MPLTPTANTSATTREAASPTGRLTTKPGVWPHGLVAEGVEAGDVVTLQFPTWAEFTIAYVAVLKVGGVVHPVPRNYNDVDLEYAMNLVGSRAYLSPTFSHNTDYEAQILSVRDAIPSLAAIAVLDKQAPSHSELPTFDDIYGRFEPLREPRRRVRRFRGLHSAHLGHHGQAEAIHAHPQQHPVLRARLHERARAYAGRRHVHALALEPCYRLLPRAHLPASARADGPCCSRTSARARPSSS